MQKCGKYDDQMLSKIDDSDAIKSSPTDYEKNNNENYLVILVFDYIKL